jgi:hypothetical protein
MEQQSLMQNTAAEALKEKKRLQGRLKYTRDAIVSRLRENELRCVDNAQYSVAYYHALAGMVETNLC